MCIRWLAQDDRCDCICASQRFWLPSSFYDPYIPNTRGESPTKSQSKHLLVKNLYYTLILVELWLHLKTTTRALTYHTIRTYNCQQDPKGHLAFFRSLHTGKSQSKNVLFESSSLQSDLIHLPIHLIPSHYSIVPNFRARISTGTKKRALDQKQITKLQTIWCPLSI